MDTEEDMSEFVMPIDKEKDSSESALCGRKLPLWLGLLLLLEEPAGILETGHLTSPLGWSLRTPASESGAPFVHQVRLPRLSNLQGPPLKHPLCAGAATGIG